MEGGASVAATGVKIVAKNQKAYHEYFIEEKFETGIELSGTEVKSIRLGNLSLKEAWCQIKAKCTLHPTSRVIFSTKTPCVRGGC